MLANRRGDFEAAARRREVGRWADAGLIDPAGAEALRGRFPFPFYAPNVFIRVGLFGFGLICASSGLGLLAILYGIGSLACAEVLARRSPKPFFRAGLEEAALYFGLACLIGGTLAMLRYHRDPDAALAWPLAALFAAASLRYVDRLLAALGLAAFVFGILDLGRDLGAAGVSVLPPILIALSAVSAWGCGRALRAKVLAPWDPIWIAVRLLSLLLAYAAGNYWVVRELGSAWLPSASVLDSAAAWGSGSAFGTGIVSGSGAGAGLPFGWAFLAFTYGVPPTYVAWGLIRKDRLCLDAGLAAVAAAVLTFKYYHHALSLEMGLIAAGSILLAIAWVCLTAFRPPRYGLSSAARRAPASAGMLDAGIAAWAAFGGQAAPGQAPEGMQGGGGKFGGGGAQGGF